MWRLSGHHSLQSPQTLWTLALKATESVTDLISLLVISIVEISSHWSQQVISVHMNSPIF